MKNAGKIFVFGVLGFLGAGLVLSGCKSAPELTKANAQALIQAKYDQSPAVGINIAVDEKGLSQGVGASYWARTKLFPNRFWADFTLTPEGKKLVKLANGGDVIQWRPDSPDDKSFHTIITSVAANHLKARDVKDPQDEEGGAKTAVYSELVSLDGLPAPLQDMAHNPGTKLSFKRTATFSMDGGAWKLASIN